MPKVIKKKTVKKTSVQDDDVKSVALQTVEALRNKQQQVLIGVSAIIIIFAIIVSISLYTSSQYKAARVIELEAGQFYYGEVIDDSMSQEDRWKKALELYQSAVDIKATPSALFYLGNTYSNLGDTENAIKQYEHFADKFSGDTGILPIVYQKLASAYFKTGQNDKALDTLGRLGKVDNGIFKDTALVLEARHRSGAGDADMALQKYREIMMEFPDSPWISEANAKISADEAEKAAKEKRTDGTDESAKSSEAPAKEPKQPQPEEAAAKE